VRLDLVEVGGARFSSNNRQDACTKNQLRGCRGYAERQGWTIAAERKDEAVSGATDRRDEFQALTRDALSGICLRLAVQMERPTGKPSAKVVAGACNQLVGPCL
jgi:hypothetical protein